MLTEEDIRNALRGVKYPGFSRDVISFGLVKHIAINGGAVNVVMSLTSPNPTAARQLKEDSERVLRALPGVAQVAVEIQQPGTPAGGTAANPWSQQSKLPGLSRIVAVASGKGGVGKSTVSVNLACGLQHLGRKVGLLDCDIYGPSVPLMMGVHEKPTISADEKMVPPVGHGVKVMSMGLLLDGDQPVIWRGPMIVKTIQQFFGAVEWGELDYLLVDLPPGTGDAQLTLCQTVALDGGVVVTTPQEASLGVVRKGIAMFQKVNVPILGIVENMSFFTAPSGERFEIFGHGGGKGEAERQGIPFLGEIPLFTEIRVAGDRGIPVVVSSPEQPSGKAFIEIARVLDQKLA
jgi:ATP-binding protein involved in chromosome partitioning